MRQFRGKLPFDKANDKLKDAMLNLKSKGIYSKWRLRSQDGMREAKQWLYTYRIRVIGSLGAVVLFAGVLYSGSQYVLANQNDIYTVYLEGERIGEISSPEVLEQLISSKLSKLENENPEVQWEIERDGIVLEKQTVFKGEVDDAATVSELVPLLEAKAVGVEVVVNGKPVAVVKDEETANRVLKRVKETYAAEGAAPQGLVSVLAAQAVHERDEDVLAEGEPRLKSVRIMEPVDLTKREIAPTDVLDEEEAYALLVKGDVKPTKYIVQEGDTPSGIAAKLGVPVHLLYSNNQDHQDLIERDLIRVGDELDLTMPQPAVTIESVESLTETIAVHYDTTVEEDETMRVGQTETIRAGKNGIKKVTYQLTKINGLLMEEKITNEEIVEEPVSAIVKRGTKIIRGEGTGSYIWPVASASLSSGYGRRWGREHKGIDIISRKKTIMAADNGVVTYAGKASDYGNHIIIDHKNGYKTLYAHLSEITIKKGEIVEKGDKIGVMGSTGRSTGVHLHFEVIKNGVEKNPLTYLR